MKKKSVINCLFANYQDFLIFQLMLNAININWHLLIFQNHYYIQEPKK